MAEKSRYLITSTLISFVAYGVTYKVQKNHAAFNEIKQLLEVGQTRKAVGAYNKGLKKEAVAGFVIKNNDFYYKGTKLPEIFAEIYRESVSNGAKLGVVNKFFDNMISNPSQMSVEDFARFLNNRKMPITDRGTFLAYKRVSANFKDTYTHTFDNTPGKMVSIERDRVDSNSSQECSYGLHVCAHNYLSNYVDDNTIVVEIDPKNVIAVPHGYNGSKLRCCEYKSLMTMTDFKKILMSRAQDVLGSIPYFSFAANNCNHL